MAVEQISLGGINYFLPIFAFFFVFIVVYALLKQTKVLGSSESVLIFISFILASFFIVQASLVDFVTYTSSWISVLIVIVFFLVLVISFVPGIKAGEFFGKGSWLAWVLLLALVVIFIFSSAYIFNWALNWSLVKKWANTEWFGMLLLVLIAAIVSWKIKS